MVVKDGVIDSVNFGPMEVKFYVTQANDASRTPAVFNL
jgi:hypothetical protein